MWPRTSINYARRVPGDVLDYSFFHPKAYTAGLADGEAQELGHGDHRAIGISGRQFQ